MQNQVGGTVWPGNLEEYWSGWFGSSKKELCLPWSLVCPWPGRRAEWQLHLLRNVFPGPIWQKYLARTSGSYMTQQCLSKEVGGQNWSSQSKASLSIQPRALGSRFAWIKTTKSFNGLEPASPTNSPTYYEYSLQPVQQGKLTRTYRKLCSSFYLPDYCSTSTDNTACAFPCLQRKTSGLTWPGYSVNILALYESPNNKPVRPWVSFCCPSRAGKLILSLIYCRVY